MNLLGGRIKAQSKKTSLFEAVTNVMVGYGVAIISQLIIFPIFGIRVSFKSNLLIGFWFTVISIIRSYALRRFFNARLEKQLNKSVILRIK